jgi:hypothetical protein
MQSLPITTKIVSLNPTHGKVYSIQYYVIKFVSDLWQVGGFLRALRFPSPIKTDHHDINDKLLKVKGEGASVLHTSAFTWILMGGKKPIISNTGSFFCFKSTVSINKMIRSVTRSCLSLKSSFLKPCFWPLFIVCTLMLLLWI